MASNKSQLDVYKLDIPTVVNEMHDSMTEEEKAEFVELEKAFLASKTDMSESAADFVRKLIDYIIGAHNKKKNSLKYNSKTLNDSVISGYKLNFFEGISHPNSPIYALLENRVEKSKTTTLSHVLFAYNKDNVFVFCSGSGWQVVSPYVDSLFGLQVMSRLIPENAEAISSVKLRGYSGTVSGQETNYRKKARASEIIEFGQLFKDLTGSIQKDVVEDYLGMEVSSKRKTIGAEFKNSFKLRKRLTLVEFADLLQNLTELLQEEPFFSIEDWLGLSPLGKTQKDKKTIKILFDEAIKQLYRKAEDDSVQLDIFVCNPNLTAYMSANSYKLSYDELEYESTELYDEMPLTEYVKKLKEYFSEENDVEQKVVNALKETMLESFIDGEEYADTSSKLIKCIQLSINYERKNYILVDGDWYVVYEGLEKKLNSELPKLIRGRKPSFALPKWESHLSEDEYLNVLTGIPYNHAKLHRKRPLDNIELCDTMFMRDKTLVLCHMKDGFNTNMRVLTAQVRSSAELLIDIKMSNRINELAAVWGRYKDEKNVPAFDIITKSILGIDGYTVEECVVFNPKDEIEKSVENNDSVIAKYELSLLIKRWGFDIPLTVSVPENSN